jgi:hypothetical protein
MLYPSYSPVNYHIKAICEQKAVKSVIHFTRVENLRSILQEGLLSRTELQKRRISVIENDKQRLDRQPNAVCLSLSFPNYQMFYRYRSSSKHTWVVLEIDTQVLWINDCAFCNTNAAASLMYNTPILQRKRPDSFNGLFADYVDSGGTIRRGDLFIPQNYPTNPQAEVLAFKPIEAKFIKAVYVERRDDALKITNSILTDAQKNILYVNSFYFRARDDYEIWRSRRS